MPVAKLLLREPAVTSLTSIVEKSQHRKPPFPEYDLRLNSCQLEFNLTSGISACSTNTAKVPSSDEGFESDLDTLSLVSTDDSVSSGNNASNRENDSANGSASSDSDTETPPPILNDVGEKSTTFNEIHNLVECMCYTDIKFPHILVFIIKNDTLVFHFDHLDSLTNFYTNFSTFKAIANQIVYSKNIAVTKFNLLQRTDKNGITHIEITNEPKTRLDFDVDKCENSSDIISLNTPETNGYYGNTLIRDDRLKNTRVEATSRSNNPLLKESSLKEGSPSQQQSESATLHDTQFRKECDTKNSHSSKVSSYYRSASTENILQSPNANFKTIHSNKYSSKIWSSAEDLLNSSPRRPERRRKPKSKAPLPPNSQEDVLHGQYVRVNVTSANAKPIETRFFGNTQKKMALTELKCVEPKRSWTASMPRFLRDPRSHSESRNFTPMAYRYIDTTQKYLKKSEPNNVSNRLFGMSAKLNDFNSDGTVPKRYDNWGNGSDSRRSSLAELSYKFNSAEGSLKSVIKKDDSKRRTNEKKVTFSAYATVQVV